MATLLRVLFIEDSDDDTQLILREIRQGGYDLEWERVDTLAAMQAALASRSWDLIISDHVMPQFSSMIALDVMKSSGQDIPFILISGSIGEDAAVVALKAGVNDFLVKGNWARLIPAIQRELRDAEARHERRLARDALQESERRFRALIENGLDEIVVFDSQLKPIYMSPSVLRASELPMEEMVEAAPFASVHPEDQLAARKLYEWLLQNPAQYRAYQLRLVRPDGSHRWTEGVAVNLLDDPGVKGIVLNYRDISERRKAEETINATEARLTGILDIAADAVIAINEGQRIILFNQSAEHIFGYKSDEVVGRPLEILLPARFAKIHQNHVDAFHAAPEIARHMGKRLEIYGRHKNGTEFAAEASISKLDQDGEMIFTVILRDVTERKRAETKIQQQLERLTALREIDQAITSAFDIGMNLNIVLSHARTLLAVDAATVLLLNPARSTLEYGAEIGFRTRVAETADVKLGESYAGTAAREQHLVQIPNLANDPNHFLPADFLKAEEFVSYYGMPLIVKGKVVGVLEVFHRSFMERDQDWLDFFHTLAGQAAIAIDNAQLFDTLQRSNIDLEHRVAERTAEFNRTNAELERANRAKDEFLANMSHELRTPLNSILGLSESLLEQRRDPLSDYQKNSLQIIESSGRHLLELINDVLDLSKIEAGMLDYYPQVVDVDTLCRSSLAFIKEQATRKSISLRYEEDAISKIYADPRRLKQILVNLLSNAVKFTPQHGQVTLQVKADAEQDRVQFAVIDTGIGIAPKDMARLFTPFVQVDSNLNRQFEGTGLGLALVQKLTDLHSGSVEVESEVGVGSRFTIHLPWGRQSVAQQEIDETGRKTLASAKQVASDPSSEASLNGKTILLAEDNKANILTIGEYLQSHGYKIVNAHDGLEAIEKAEEANPEIILMDIQMPTMDGLEAIRRLREKPRFKSTPIIALTALAMPGDRERCLTAGANEYMSKPVGLKKLYDAIRDLLDKRETSR